MSSRPEIEFFLQLQTMSGKDTGTKTMELLFSFPKLFSSTKSPLKLKLSDLKTQEIKNCLTASMSGVESNKCFAKKMRLKKVREVRDGRGRKLGL